MTTGFKVESLGGRNGQQFGLLVRPGLYWILFLIHRLSAAVAHCALLVKNCQDDELSCVGSRGYGTARPSQSMAVFLPPHRRCYCRSAKRSGNLLRPERTARVRGGAPGGGALVILPKANTKQRASLYYNVQEKPMFPTNTL